jgi:hypothetical protein
MKKLCAIKTGLIFLFCQAGLMAVGQTKTPVEGAGALNVDRVGFPKGYAQTFEVLRLVCKTNEHKFVTVYGNNLPRPSPIPFSYPIPMVR